MHYSNKFFTFLSELSHPRLKNQIAFLKVENQILRNKCPYIRINLNDKEKNRLIKFGLPLGGDIKRIISIVNPSTFYDWLRKRRDPHYTVRVLAKQPDNRRCYRNRYDSKRFLFFLASPHS